ncbi:cytochrome P450 [Mycena latifolia]|nr:cytochrome P450 [Mycena latifolia]
MISALLLACAALLTFSIFGVFKCIRTVFFHPLSNVPGPWYAAVSDLWLTSHTFRFQNTEIIHELLKKYGPVVRIGPDKVAFCDAEVMRDIYLVQKFEKSQFYKAFKIRGVEQSLTLLDNASHSARRKASGPHYTVANIALLQPEIQNHTLELVESLESCTVSVDCLHLLRNFMADNIVFSTFGYNLGALQKWTMNTPDDFSVAISDFPKKGMLMGLTSTLFSPWAWEALCRIPHERWKKLAHCDEFLEEFVVARIEELQHQVHTGKEFEKVPFVSRLLEYRSSSNEALPFSAVVAEAVSHMIAGTETTSTTLSYFFWKLSCRSDVMQKLQKEIDNVMPDPRVIPDLSVLQNLPYLNAFISEGLRLHGVLTGILERVVPSTGNYNLMGYSLPPGTVVATQPWSIHRDPRVFPRPDEFDPDRWLDDSKEGSADRAARMMPFGIGTRICAGQHFAQAVIRIAVAAVVRNFVIRPDSTTTQESMKMRHSFVAFPAAGECKLIFVPRRE